MANEKVDWIKIKNEYINSNVSYRNLAQKYNIPFQTLRDRALKEKWVNERKIQRNKIGTKTAQKTAEKISEEESDRLSRINSVADRLLDKMEEAIEQLNNHLVKNKKKTKIIEYNNCQRPDKPTKEVVEEFEETEFIAGDVDRLGLKMLAGALKDVLSVSQDDDGEDEKLKEILEKIEGNI